jgi:hypothetical protein
MRASVYAAGLAPWRHDEVSLRRDLTTRTLFKDAEHRNQTVERLRSNYIVTSSNLGECCTSCFSASHNWSTKIDKDPQGIAIKPGTPVALHRCAYSQPRYTHTVPRSSG